MQQAGGGDFTNATDLADYLVRKGIPFREVHGIVGQIVQAPYPREKEIRRTASDVQTILFCLEQDSS